jgi:GNAT superfamily N-acetyltransferase
MNMKEITFQEVEELANTGEWPMLVTAVACRKYDPDYISGKRKTTFSAIFQDDNVACVFGFEYGFSERSGEMIYIGPLCVHESYRGQGFGSLAVFAFKVMAKNLQQKLLLYAHKDVQGFYEKHHFVPVYEVEEDYQAMEWVPNGGKNES